jgi:predicted transcriptional regulator of viral defense system
MGQRKTCRSLLQAHAVEHHGYVTRQDARRLGVPGEAFDRMVERGRLARVAGDLYRLEGMPHSRRHTLAEAVLRVGRDAFLSHDSVLALHELTEHEPQTVRVATPHRHRSAGWPQHVEVLRRQVPAEDLTTYRGIRSTTVARALFDCRDLLSRSQLVAAAEQAVERGLLLRRERNDLIEALELAGV